MNVVLDILGSLVIRGAIVLVILNLNLELHNELYKKTLRGILSDNLTASCQTLWNDINLIGYNYSPPTSAITAATSTSITFRADTDNNGSTEVVSYSLGPMPGDTTKILYRTVAGVSNEIGRNIFKFDLKYYDNIGQTTSTLTAIKSIGIVVRMKSSTTFDNVTPVATWERTIFPINLR